MRASGEDYKAYNRRRWGSDGWTNSLPGKRQGDKFRNWAVWPNTLHAARLLHMAGERGGWELQHRAKGLLFRYIYEEGKNASDLATLEEAAEELGLEGGGAYLRGDGGKREVVQQAREASGMGISGVPFFVCYREGEEDADPVTMSGAQPPKAFRSVIQKLGA